MILDSPEPRVLVTRLHPAATLPALAHPGDAGAQLFAARRTEIPPQSATLIPTGLAMALPAGFGGLVVSAGDTPGREQLCVIPSVLDAGCRDEIIVQVQNSGATPAVIEAGDVIAKIVVQEITTPQFMLAERLPGSQRAN